MAAFSLGASRTAPGPRKGRSLYPGRRLKAAPRSVQGERTGPAHPERKADAEAKACKLRTFPFGECSGAGCNDRQHDVRGAAPARGGSPGARPPDRPRGRRRRPCSGCGRSGRSSSRRRRPAGGGRGAAGSWSRRGRSRTATTSPGSTSDGVPMPLRNRARTMPSWIWFAVPSSNTSTRATVKSVSTALVAAYSTAVIGPVSSRSSASGGVAYDTTSAAVSIPRRSPSASHSSQQLPPDRLRDRDRRVVVVGVRLLVGRRWLGGEPPPARRWSAVGVAAGGGHDGRALPAVRRA